MRQCNKILIVVPFVFLLLISLWSIPAAFADAIRPPQVMLPNVYHDGVNITDFWVSEKLDGVRGYWNGKVLRTRAGYIIHAPDWFTADWPNVAMDGELWIGRGTFNEVSGIIRAASRKDDAWRKVHFMVFDLPADRDTFDARVKRMRSLLGESAIPWLQPIHQFRLSSTGELDARLHKIVAGGGERLVLHRGAAHYHSGQSDNLLKYKPHDDAKARVLGYRPGRGKYTGMLGSLLVERPDGLRFHIGTGFTDAERENPPPIGSWVTYRFNGLTANGVPRFARFLRVRREGPPKALAASR